MSIQKGNYNEREALLPTMNYGWSKFGRECAVQNVYVPLILRVCMTEKPLHINMLFMMQRPVFISS